MDNNYKNPEVRFKGFTEGWKIDYIGSHYDFKNGLNKGKEYFGYGKPIVNFTDVFHKRGLLAQDLKGKVDVTNDEIKNYSVQVGDIFFTRTSETIEEIGRPSVMLGESSNTVFSGFVLRARSIGVDPLEISFKQYAFFTDFFRSEMIKKSSMTTRALTSGTAIRKMIFAFPENKTEQKQIGIFFQNLDNLITLHQKKYDKLVTLKKAMLVKMFPKKGANVPEIRFKGFIGNWVEKKLGEIIPLRGGFAFKSDNFISDGIPIVKISNILASGQIGGKFNYYKEVIADENYTLPNNAALLAMSGATTGKVSILSNPTEKKVYQNQRVGYFEDRDLVNYQFISAILRSNLFSGKINSILTTGAQPNISSKEIDFFEFYVPVDRLEQKKIGSYFKNFDNQIALHKTQLDKLNTIKKACFSKMFVTQD
ncbi:restriction endonuclease subunit S [Flavobacterium frigidarium]|uniref:restriction endonuclease subunit S n=1 Tax=Flavobacterium frigidarium TaxID=99286 RepID=UPI0030DB70EA|tara:strand:+ start:1850 stop:3118 length:1269 start_codon:yes stop_codon:yes gene_type:complete